MSRYHSYLNSAVAILSSYKGEEPFATFIKKYFAQHKKFGSKDRKQVSHLCYCFFRLGKALQGLPIEERILIALFFCSAVHNDVLQQLKPEWNENVTVNFLAKQKLVGHSFSVNEIFAGAEELSDAIHKEAFILSHFEQPDLFLRLRPGKEKNVLQKLTNGEIAFERISDTCIAIPNSSKIDDLIAIDKEAVIQDYNSQRVGEFMELVRRGSSDKHLQDYSQEKVAPFLKNLKPQTLIPAPSVWDCCAASGGKSIMAKDVLGDVDLVVSDVRESILINLQKRFAAAGIKNYESFVADLSKPLNITLPSFNLIIADVPCTGSGTWSRTPEQLYYFDNNKIDEYAALQRKIVGNALPQLGSDGYLLYITCSVFKKENEENVEFIKEKLNLEEIQLELLTGYDKKADTLFAALLKKK